MGVVEEVARVLDEPAALDPVLARHGIATVLAVATHEGVDALLAYLRPDVPELAARRRDAVIEEELRSREMRRFAGALASSGIHAALIKGCALAFTLYPQPWCRPRLDLDALVAPGDVPRAASVLAALGYVRAGKLQGRFVNHQDAYERTPAAGFRHTIDLHWQATNRAFFIDRVPAGELLARAVPASFAGDGAWQLAAADHLIVASIHRAAHHSDHMRLIWQRDQWLLARSLEPGEAATYRDRVTAKGLASLAARDLRDVAERFGPLGGSFDARVIEALSRLGNDDPARRYLTPNRSVLADLWADVIALPHWRDRLQLVREHLAPPPEFLLRHRDYPHRALLPWLYARRVARGAVKWIREAAR